MKSVGLKIGYWMHLIDKNKYTEKRQIALIEASPLFDKKWYLSQYPDVKKRKMKAAKHYIKLGYKEGRNPSPYFDGKDYLRRYKDVAKSGVNPLVHYLLHGAKEGRSYNAVACPAKLLVRNNIDYNPRISVVIPIYNAEPYLAELLDSITGQTLKEIEIICVDDGSTDKSLEVLKKYSQKDKRITILQQNNMHAGVARNSGVTVAKGKYIHFMDADDWLYDKDVYKKLYKIAKKQNFCNVIRFKGVAYDCVTKEKIAHKGYEMKNIDKKYKNTFINTTSDTDIFTKLCVVPWLGIIKRDFIKKYHLRFNNLICCNDRSFFVLSGLIAKDIYLADINIVKHRVNISSSLRGIRDKHFDCHFKSMMIIQEFLKNKRIPNNIAKQIIVLELDDLIGFFKTYIYKSKYSYNIYKSSINFMKRCNIADYEPYVNKLPSYKYNILLSLVNKKGKSNRYDYFIEKYINKFSEENISLFKSALTYPIQIKEEYDRLKVEIKMLKHAK